MSAPSGTEKSHLTHKFNLPGSTVTVDIYGKSSKTTFYSDNDGKTSWVQVFVDDTKSEMTECSGFDCNRSTITNFLDNVNENYNKSGLMKEHEQVYNTTTPRPVMITGAIQIAKRKIAQDALKEDVHSTYDSLKGVPCNLPTIENLPTYLDLWNKIQGKAPERLKLAKRRRALFAIIQTVNEQQRKDSEMMDNVIDYLLDII